MSAGRERRAALARAAREARPQAGVYQARNRVNGRVLVEATPNLKTMNGRQAELRRGACRHRALQADLDALGPEAFVFEVLEVLEDDPDRQFPRDALKALLARWLERLQPYGERGYHGPPPEARPALVRAPPGR